jgi:hypothetical protein
MCLVFSFHLVALTRLHTELPFVFFSLFHNHVSPYPMPPIPDRTLTTPCFLSEKYSSLDGFLRIFSGENRGLLKQRAVPGECEAFGLATRRHQRNPEVSAPGSFLFGVLRLRLAAS